MKKDIKEWINDYEENTGKHFEESEEYQLIWLSNRGIYQFKDNEKALKINLMYGDLDFWNDVAILTAGKKKIIYRNPLLDLKNTKKHQGKELKEWIHFYEKKTDDKFEIPENFNLLFLYHRGFSQYALNHNAIMIHHTCGDGLFWKDIGEIIARKTDKKMIRTILSRNPYVYLRSFHVKIHIEERVKKNGQECIQLHANDEQGRYVFVSQQPGEHELYYVTQKI